MRAMKLRCIWILILAILGLENLKGQCGTQMVLVGSGSATCPVDLIQVVGWLPMVDGLMRTQIWSGNDADPNSTNPTLDYLDVFPIGSSGLPEHTSLASDTILWPMVGINYTSTSASNSYPVPYPWPTCLQIGCAGAGNIVLGAEQAQQDGWLLLPDSLNCIEFMFSSQTAKSAALYIGTDSSNFLDMVEVIACPSPTGCGTSQQWNIPLGLPRTNGGNGFRYVRIRIYHQNSSGLADTELKWNIRNGIETIPRTFFQSVSTANAVMPRPAGMKVGSSSIRYTDGNGGIFVRQPNEAAGQEVLRDKRFKQDYVLLDTHLKSLAGCDTIADCGLFDKVIVRRYFPNPSRSVYSTFWTTNSYMSFTPGQQEYQEAFGDWNGGLPNDITSPDSNSSAATAFGANPVLTQKMQAMQDAWLIVPPKLKLLEFRLGDTATSQASALWLGRNFGNMTEVAREVDGIQTGGTFEVPLNCDTTTFGWRLIRARYYIFDDGGDHDSRIRWDLGHGMKFVSSDYLHACNGALDNSAPTYIQPKVLPNSREYGLRLADGTIWRPNSTNPLRYQVSIRDSLELIIDIVRVDSCGNNPPNATLGPPCQALFLADPCNGKPIANDDDNVDAIQNQPRVIHSLWNDSDPNGDSIRIVGFASFPNLTAPPVYTDSTIIYQTPNLQSGTDEFQYIIQDNGTPQLRDTAWIRLYIARDLDLDHISDIPDLDDDNDGIADSIESQNARNTGDTDGDGVPDWRDLDSDNDGSPDVVELGWKDPNVDGRVALDSLHYLMYDITGNGVDDSTEIITPLDSDIDGVPDYLDLDADNDGIFDIVEFGFPQFDSTGAFDYFPDPDTLGWNPIAKQVDENDRDGDGVLDRLDLDSDNDGVPNLVEASFTDMNRDGRIDNVTDTLDGAESICTIAHKANNDQDNVPNYLDCDSDNDGIPDIVEAWGNHDTLTDSRGRFLLLPGSTANGWIDTLGVGRTWDMDGDLLPTFVDLDSDADGLYDRIEETRDWQGTIGFIVAVQDSTGWGWDLGGRIVTSLDVDNDSVPNRMDLDSDNDGISDVVESGGSDGMIPDGMIDTVIDGNNDGMDDTRMRLQKVDSDLDNWENHLDLDADNDGVVDFDEVNGVGRTPLGYIAVSYSNDSTGWSSAHRIILDLDIEGDSVPNRIDLDSDNDGIYDCAEALLPSALSWMDTLTPFGRLDHLNSNMPYDVSFAQDTVIDSDGDLFPDFQDHDSDNDGLCDLFEDIWLQSDNGVGSLSAPSGTNIEGIFPNQMRRVSLDYDGDNVPNFRDLDSDQDGIPDVKESGGLDANRDGKVDGLLNNLGWVVFPVIGNSDIDSDSLPPHLDHDSDNDGIADIVEGYGEYSQLTQFLEVISDSTNDGWDDRFLLETILDTDADAAFDFLDNDSDGDRLYDFWESIFSGVNVDADQDGLVGASFLIQGWDSLEGTLEPVDFDGDSRPDYRDLDSDNDSIPDQNEYEFRFPEFDCNSDGWPNWQDSLPCDLYFYEGFSPNGDGINDEYQPEGISYHRWENEFTVYNRWGEVVYKSNGWDGLWRGDRNVGLSSGEPAVVGVYFFTFDFGPKLTKRQKGYIYLRR